MSFGGDERGRTGVGGGAGRAELAAAGGRPGQREDRVEGASTET